MILGAFAIIASATRIVLVTAFAGLAALAAWRGRWRELVLITVVFVGALAIRPDLLGRFIALAPGSPSSTPSSGGSAAPTLGPQPNTGLVEGDTSLQYRIFVWRVLLRAWQATPVLGIGPGMAASTIEAVSPTSRRQAPHNDYIGMLTEAGVLGLLLLLSVQGAVLAQLLRRGQGDWKSTG